MDIGDPSEIPATRKRLPSMQELGAFDDEPEAAPARPRRVHPAPGAVPAAPAVADMAPSANMPLETVPPSAPDNGTAHTATSTAPPAVAAARPSLTPEQLRQALAKADPVTRQKLLRLIAGGRTIQQVGAKGGSDTPSARSLVMGLTAEPTQAQAPDKPSAKPSHKEAVQRPPAPTGAQRHASPPAGPRQGAGRPLMQIDENTELLDAAPSASVPLDERHPGLQAQLDAALQQASPRPDPAAHKVLFPAYDPSRHGEDVHSAASRRRPDGPVEGHFPAPRQPFRASYKHPDGKPMSPEESKVEEVLQAQRCEETLSVLAREGVNGLLLSPRDLDAAVNQGLLSAETAATLWKTWAALRPVIHVIEDEPPDPPAPVALTDEPAPLAGPEVPDTTVSQAVDPADGGPEIMAEPTPVPVPPPAKPVAQTGVVPPSPAPRPQSKPPETARADASVPLTEPVPDRQRAHIEPARGPVWSDTEPHAEAEPAPLPAKAPARSSQTWLRLKRLLRWVFWAFVAYSAITTGLKYGVALWHTGWGWALLDWLQQLRQR